MAPFAVIHREGDFKMTCATELSVKVILHIEMTCSLQFDIEYIGVTICAIEPLLVFIMGKLCPRDQSPVRLYLELSGELYWLKILFQDTLLWLNQTFFLCTHPIDLIAISYPGQVLDAFKAFLRPIHTKVVAINAVFFGVPEGNFTIVTGAAKLARPVVLLGDLGRIGLHSKFQFKMADPAGIARPV